MNNKDNLKLTDSLEAGCKKTLHIYWIVVIYVPSNHVSDNDFSVWPIGCLEQRSASNDDRDDNDYNIWMKEWL